MRRQKDLDYLKAFAVILVVFYHAIYAAGLFWGNMFYICLDIALEHIHVPLFMLIAGYLCHKQNVKKFYIKKIKRILIPFVFMSVLKLLYNNLISSEFTHEGSISEQIFDAFICGGTYWFCYCLLVIFAIAPLFWDRRKLMWTVLAVLIAANTVMRWTGTGFTDVLQIDQVLCQMPFFLIGMILSSCSAAQLIKRKKNQYLLLFAGIAAGGICGYFRFALDVHRIWIIDFVFGLSAMFLLYFIAARLRGNIADKILSTISSFSLQIMFFDSFYRVVLYLLVYLILEKGFLAALAVTVLDITVSCGTCFILRRIPGVCSLVGLEYLSRTS